MRRKSLSPLLFRAAILLAAAFAPATARADDAASQVEAAPTEEERVAAALATIEARAAKGFEELKLPGLAFGLVRGQELVLAKGYGVANVETGDAVTPATPFQIGSISKVFTSTLLMILREEGKVRLDDPVAQYLPEGTAMPPANPRGAKAITLRHLVTHTSGLPSLPPNLEPTESDPYNGYSEELLLAGLSTLERPDPIGAWFGYSNWGCGLLGYALGRADGRGYEAALRERVLKPLGMDATTYGLENAALGGTRGHGDALFGKFAVVDDWNLGVLGPAGAIVSNVEDMAKFLALHLRDGEAESAVLSGGSLFEAHEPQRLAGGWDTMVGVGWMASKVEKKEDAPAGVDRVVWHNGGTSGYNSWAGLSPRAKVAVVLLANHGDRRAVDELGRELLLMAARELAPPPAPAPERVREIVEKLAGCFAQSPDLETLRAVLHPEFAKQVPVEQVGMVFLSLYYQLGECEGWDVAPAAADPNYFVARFHFAKDGGEPAKLVLAFDDAESPEGKVVTAFFPPRKPAGEKAGEAKSDAE